MARMCLTYEIYPTENLMTLICPFNFIKGQMSYICYKVNWKAIYDLLYVFNTYFDHMMHHLWDTTHWRSVTLIWPLKVIQGQRSQGQLKDHIWLCICVKYNISHSMHCFWDIGLNR